MSGVADLERVVLDPLAGRPAVDWSRESGGKGTPAQIVEHLALSLELSARGFEKTGDRRPPRSRTLVERVACWLVFDVGWTPPVRAARRTVPMPEVDAPSAERHFREGLARWAALEARAAGRAGDPVYVEHPRLGPLHLEDWLRFHAWHCRHHAKQIRRRLG